MTTKVFKHAKIYTGQEMLEDGFIRFDKEIQEVGKMQDFKEAPHEETINMAGKIIIPGFIDVHTHGGYGIDVMDGSVEKLNQLSENLLQEGITSYFATTMTQSTENIATAVKTVGEASSFSPTIQGIHLEGPFLSKVFKGAQPEDYICVANIKQLEEWNRICGGHIRLVTYAPEAGDLKAFEEYCIDENIILSVGHSNATRAQLLESKASHVTHLYNAQRGLHHREPGVTGHAFLEDNMYVEIIADGFHIHPDMIKLAYRVKGAHKIILITDSMRSKGMPDGESELGGQKVFVKDKQARLEDGTLAGSVLKFSDAFKNVIAFTGCGLEEAVLMSSVNQAREFGLNKKGHISTGKDADMVVMNEELDIIETVSYGTRIMQK